ncbi:DUF1707 domain-containing protein [Actinosynnema sp. NPDC020468]|uniref:DUF1707 SHOCT-like domain-containing protein n=1 Tax=Actinosynnema sp. NPDC020468 TaxID=3154488 RepID=UPI0033F5CC8F
MGERDIRIGDAERGQALELLGTHLGEGRLSVDEYGERSALVTAAKTRGELLALFADLPGPHPVFAQTTPLPTVTAGAAPVERRRFELDPRLGKVAVPLVVLTCVGLYMLIKVPAIFLLIPVVVILVGSFGGGGGHGGHGRDRRRR